MELVCPAGNPTALRGAIDSGADTVYVGLHGRTNARQFPGLNFSPRELERAVGEAHARGVRILLAINTFAQPADFRSWTEAVDRAAELKMHGVILADVGVLEYAARNHPDLPRHLSVQASATSGEALQFYYECFGIRRAVLPRVLSLAQIEQVTRDAPVEIEVFGFGSLCIMAEGRCLLSSYATGESPNTVGACSPAAYVRWDETPDGTLSAHLNGVLIDRFAPSEHAGYPTLCKGRFEVAGKTDHALEEPTSLNTLELLSALQRAGVRAIKLEGRQRSPGYIRQVVRVWRQAIDRCLVAPESYAPTDEAQDQLRALSEGSQTTFGAYQRAWH